MTTKKSQEEAEGLNEFKWDSENTFFGITDEDAPDSVGKIVDDLDDDDEPEKVTATTTKKSEKTASKQEPEEDEDDDEKDTDGKKDDKFFDEGGGNEGDDDKSVTLLDLAKNVLFTDIELPADLKDEDLTVEKIEELKQENNDKIISEAIEGFREDAGEVGVQLMKYVMAGGDSLEFFRSLKEHSEVPTGDIENTDNQKEIIRHYLKTFKKSDNEEINDTLAFWEENGKLKRYAEKYKTEMDEYYEKERQELVRSQQEQANLNEQKRKEATKKLTDEIAAVDKIGNYKISKTDKSKLINDITKASIKVGNNKFITPLQQKLSEVYKDNKKLLLLAKVVMSDFDTSDIETEIAANVTRRIKNNLVTSSKITPSSSNKERKRSLSDFFTD